MEKQPRGRYNRRNQYNPASPHDISIVQCGLDRTQDRVILAFGVPYIPVLLVGCSRITSSQYQLGKKPTLSSPLTTSSSPERPSSSTLTPDPGTNLTRHTDEVSDPLQIELFKNVKKRLPQSRQTRGSHAPGLPRTRRGICIVLNDCTVVTTPAGVRNPTTISCLPKSMVEMERLFRNHTGTPSKKDWK